MKPRKRKFTGWPPSMTKGCKRGSETTPKVDKPRQHRLLDKLAERFPGRVFTLRPFSEDEDEQS